MIIKTIVPKLGTEMDYLGKPVKNGVDARIGSISEVVDVGDHYELIMVVETVYSKPDRDMYSGNTVGIFRNNEE